MRSRTPRPDQYQAAAQSPSRLIFPPRADDEFRRDQWTACVLDTRPGPWRRQSLAVAARGAGWFQIPRIPPACQERLSLASAPPATQHQLPLGMCLRRCSVRFMLWPAGLLALLDWSDLECSSGRRGRVHRSLPEVSHPHSESGMTTPPFSGRTMTGLTPAGALPLQAARCVAIFI